MSILPQDDAAYQLYCDEQDERHQDLIDEDQWNRDNLEWSMQTDSDDQDEQD